MQVLWAPWRMDYILSENKEGSCIFCPGEDRNTDEGRLILYVGSMTMVVMNRFPYVNGHLLVAPVKHVPDFEGLSDEESLTLLQMLRKSIDILKTVMNPEGFNVGLNLGKVAGAGVKEHLHFHIVPRWNGDTNFMTVVGETRVISEDLTNTRNHIISYFERISHQEA